MRSVEVIYLRVFKRIPLQPLATVTDRQVDGLWETFRGYHGYNHGYEFRNQHTWPHYSDRTQDDPNQKLRGMTIY